MKTPASNKKGAIKITTTKKSLWPEIIIILLIGFIIYSPGLNGVYLMDDYSAIKRNQFLVDVLQFKWLTNTPAESNLPGRPFVQWSFAINKMISGDSLLSYHVFNVFLHLTNALFILLLLRFLLFEKLNLITGIYRWIPFAITLLWCVHPIHTHAVTYLSQRAEIQMSLGVLGALYFTRLGINEKLNLRHTFLALFFTFLAIGSKESGVLIPFIVVSFHYVFGRETVWAIIKRNLALYIGFIAGMIFFIFLFKDSKPAEFIDANPYSSIDYLKMQSVIFFDYAKVFFVPFNYPFDFYWSYIPSMPTAILFLILQLLLFCLSIFLMSKRNWMGWPLFTIFVLLAPTTSFIPLLDPMVIYRYYLPGFFLLLLFIPGVLKLSEYLVTKKVYSSTFSVYLLISLFSISVLVYGNETFSRNELHKSASTIWTDTVNKNPENPRAHLNSGIAFLKSKNIEEAFNAFKKAELLYKRSDQGSLIKYHIGISYFAMEQYDSSIVYFSQAIELNKNYWEAYIKRGHSYLYLKDFQSAYNDQQTALQHIKDNPELYMQCAYSLIQLGRKKEARNVIDTAQTNGNLIPSDFMQMINSQ